VRGDETHVTISLVEQ